MTTDRSLKHGDAVEVRVSWAMGMIDWVGGFMFVEYDGADAIVTTLHEGIMAGVPVRYFADDVRRDSRAQRAQRERERVKHEARERRRLKKLALAAGYRGASGGWVYKVKPATGEWKGGTTWTPVVQGWQAFAHQYGARIGYVPQPFVFPGDQPKGK